MVEPHKIKKISQKSAEQNNKFRIFLKNNADADELDAHFHKLHNEIFYKYNYDCCKCNNCCKSYDIRIEQTDIAVISKYLGNSESDFIDKYLTPDKEENDCFIMKDKPCCFLDSDGKCQIYESRPSVCRNFPYTNKPDRLYNMLGMLSFAEDCPVVFEIIESLKLIYSFNG
jgi:Fe-S-cluster containining protein